MTDKSTPSQVSSGGEGALRTALERASKVAHLMEGMHFENGDVMSPEAQLSVASCLAAEIDAALAAPSQVPDSGKIREIAKDILEYHDGYITEFEGVPEEFRELLRDLSAALAPQEKP